ncbi:biopolymer transporter ExbD [Croceivirga lutea]|uniref:ExbD/TolR family protein n=1 Tax=Croceivirga lutea TaxID=1775167 RepID=UPI00163A7A45|nr:biopolymer transporter ExbD [Croceivirga lutea]GGG54735.1 biopolymer transporter ExbD [Croceivirga lutea]
MKFKTKKSNSSLPPVSTASLPDIVFILLFFFMTVTVFKDQNLLVENTIPMANQAEKFAKVGVIEIIIGKPLDNYQANYGTEPVLQLGNKIGGVHDVSAFVLEELSLMPEHLRAKATVNLKIDENVKLGIVNDVKKTLSKINMLKVNYIALKK